LVVSKRLFPDEDGFVTKICRISLVLLAGLGLTTCSNFPKLLIPHDALTPEEHLTLGMSYESQGLPALAEREYQAVLRGQPDHPGALLALGNHSFERGALQEAEQYYRRVLITVPEHAAASNNLAMVYLQRGDNLEEAERLAARALQGSGPLRPYVLDTLAHIYIRQGRDQEAMAALNEAEKAAPRDDTILHERLAQARRELAGNPGKAGKPASSSREPTPGLGKN
jgi:tetratricopeptide (TPR) repeat protein